MGNVVSIPSTKMDHVSQEELDEYNAQRNGEDNLYEAGILGVPNAYDPEAGSKYDKIPVPTRHEGPLLATDEGQPKDVEAKVLSRDSNRSVDKSEGNVVRSGRKSTKPNSGE